MAENNIQEIVVFNEDTSPIILNILEKNNLLENDEQVLEKFDKGEELRAATILSLVEKIILGKLQKGSLTSSIQDSLKISSQIAQGIAMDIESRLLPLGRKATQEDIDFLQKEDGIGAPAPKDNVFEPMPLYEKPDGEIGNPPALKTPLTPIERAVPQDRPTGLSPFEKPLPQEPAKIEEKPSAPKTSDNYREPLV